MHNSAILFLRILILFLSDCNYNINMINNIFNKLRHTFTITFLIRSNISKINKINNTYRYWQTLLKI